MAAGFIQISRHLFEHPAWIDSTPEQKVLLLTIIEKANYKPRTWVWNGQQVNVDRGQFITSLDKLVEAGGKKMTTAKVRTALKRFEMFGILTTKTTNKSTLITVDAYDILTCGPDENSKQNDTDIANDYQADDKQIATTNKVISNKSNNSLFKDVPTELLEAFVEWNDMRIGLGKGINSRGAVSRILNRLQDLAPDDYEEQIAIIHQATDGSHTDLVALRKGPAVIATDNSRLGFLDDFAKGGC